MAIKFPMYEVRYKGDHRYKFWVRADDFNDPVRCRGISDCPLIERDMLEWINIEDPKLVAQTQTA